jgi:predicted SnoaL-like aldol condensation-catalyzing enzyme
MQQRKCEGTAAIAMSHETGKRAPIASIDSRLYTQHNLNLGDGLEPLLEFIDGLSPDQIKATVIRKFEDGPFSVIHAEYVLGSWGPMVGFDVHRWKEDRIVEHWDNLCSTKAANESGHTMTDGSTEVSDLDKTAENKALVASFTDRVLLGRHLTTGVDDFLADTLVQHSPHYGDGVRSFQEQLGRWTEQERFSYVRVHKILGEGNMVLTMGEGIFQREPTAFYDLYRIASGRVAEHWEVFETIPPRELWKNDNGKF